MNAGNGSYSSSSSLASSSNDEVQRLRRKVSSPAGISVSKSAGHLGSSAAWPWLCESRSEELSQRCQCPRQTTENSTGTHSGKSKVIHLSRDSHVQSLITETLSSASKPLYDKSGLFESDQTDRCDCNRLKCPGCFLPCSTCQSSKCGLECRKCHSSIWSAGLWFVLGNLRTYSYEYRLYGTSKEILQQ